MKVAILEMIHRFNANLYSTFQWELWRGKGNGDLNKNNPKSNLKEPWGR